MKTKICELLGIEYPVIQGGMAWVANASLVIGVSKAGGLGTLAAANAPADYVRDEIRKIRAATDKPFAVNIMLMSPYVEDIAKLVVEEKVPIVTTGAGLPTKYMKEWVAAGIKVIPVVPSCSIAKLVARAGAAAVIAEGGESGGHIGDLSTMALVPQVCDAVSIPVIAAGGIADGRGMAASLMLGASGIQMGTRFLVAKECTIHQTYKNKILAAKDIDTITTGKRLGHPVRALKTPFTRAFLKNENDTNKTIEELEEFGAGALRKAVIEGDETAGCFMAGQSCGLVKKEQTAEEIIKDVVTEADTILRGAAQWVK
ncbi:MAG: enoyl-[acyl-carrier-protein] reductase FabK [Eubacteriales bacterium]|nr:enoyl-[acyl-carrier-protein] reductase FabK [Eubacteriales bacterium]MDD3349325.1 enoyl-[acyl-carrier-protein] reductase FabK [Eubacteriales bacterium]